MTIALTDLQKQEISNYINNYRTIHQVPGLMWDDAITFSAQNWAEHLISNNQFKHSGNPLYGENIAFLKDKGTDMMTLLKLAIDNWYNEIKYYNFNIPEFSTNTGHFTCLVWKSSTTFALGFAIDLYTKTAYVVMNTYPPGNHAGLFQQNVLPSTASIPSLIPLEVPLEVPIEVPIEVSNFDMNTHKDTHIKKSLGSIIKNMEKSVPVEKTIYDLKNLKFFVKNVSSSNLLCRYYDYNNIHHPFPRPHPYPYPYPYPHPRPHPHPHPHPHPRPHPRPHPYPYPYPRHNYDYDEDNNDNNMFVNTSNIGSNNPYGLYYSRNCGSNIK